MRRKRNASHVSSREQSLDMLSRDLADRLSKKQVNLLDAEQALDREIQTYSLELKEKMLEGLRNSVDSGHENHSVRSKGSKKNSS